MTIRESGGSQRGELHYRQEIDRLSQIVEQQKSEIRFLREMLGAAYEKMELKGVK